IIWRIELKESKVKALNFRRDIIMLSEESLRESLTRFLGRIGEELASNTISRLNLLADLIAELEGLLVRLNKVEKELSRAFSQVIMESIRRVTPGCVSLGFISDKLSRALPGGINIEYRMTDRQAVEFLYFLLFLDAMVSLGYDTVTNGYNRKASTINLQVKIPALDYANLDDALESCLPTLHIRKGSSSMAVFFKPMLWVNQGVIPTLQVYKGFVRASKYVATTEKRPNISKVVADLSIVNGKKVVSYAEVRRHGNRYYVDVISRELQPLYTLYVASHDEKHIVEKQSDIIKAGRKRIIVVSNEGISPWELRRAKEEMVRDIRSLAIQSIAKMLD
ncbi:MAG: hypothetical protein J7L12_02945, partial [Desulfurococcales archaeon]|nr:hypothetical protein [Desulfurococcales archaeon]